jgi:hypothetical protein
MNQEKCSLCDVSNAANLLEKGEIDQKTYDEMSAISKDGFPDMYEHMPFIYVSLLKQITTFNA